MNKVNVKLKIKLKFRVNPWLFIRNRTAVYEDPDGVYDVYELYKLVFPFVYKWTGTSTLHERGCPFDKAKLHRIVERVKEKGHV